MKLSDIIKKTRDEYRKETHRESQQEYYFKNRDTILEKKKRQYHNGIKGLS
jgi:hypothetical protein